MKLPILKEVLLKEVSDFEFGKSAVQMVLKGQERRNECIRMIREHDSKEIEKAKAANQGSDGFV